MKKLFTLVCVLALGAALSVAQTGAGSSGDQTSTKTADTKKPGKAKTKKSHKGGKKSKKGSSSTTPPPK